MHTLKKIALGFFILTDAAALYIISFGIFSGSCAPAEAAAVNFICAAVFIACTAAIILIFIIDREKPLIFAVLYIAAVVCGAVPALLQNLF